MKNSMAAAVLLILAGCATGGGNQNSAKIEYEQTIPTCAGEVDCAAKWEAAQLWVVKNSALKIQTATTVLIETYGPGQYDPTLAMRVTKEPQGGGVYRIVFSGGCNNMFGCNPNRYEAGVRFNQAIAAVSP